MLLVIILGIDTSCDDTSVAMLDGTRILSDVVSSQVPLHSRFGGVVPEIASRKHAELIDRIYNQALDDAGLTLSDVEIIAVTQGPGLIGSLLVGLSFAKGLALATGVPLVAVNHVEAHALSIFLEEEVEFPLSLLSCRAVTAWFSSSLKRPGFGCSAPRGTTRLVRPSTKSPNTSLSATRGEGSSRNGPGREACICAIPEAHER